LKFIVEQNGERLIYSEGELSFSPFSFDKTHLDIEAVRSRCNQCLESDRIYRRLKAFGFDYRVLFKQARGLDRGKRSITRINLPQSIKQSAKDLYYIQHNGMEHYGH